MKSDFAISADALLWIDLCPSPLLSRSKLDLSAYKYRKCSIFSASEVSAAWTISQPWTGHGRILACQLGIILWNHLESPASHFKVKNRHLKLLDGLMAADSTTQIPLGLCIQPDFLSVGHLAALVCRDSSANRCFLLSWEVISFLSPLPVTNSQSGTTDWLIRGCKRSAAIFQDGTNPSTVCAPCGSGWSSHWDKILAWLSFSSCFPHSCIPESRPSKNYLYKNPVSGTAFRESDLMQNTCRIN